MIPAPQMLADNLPFCWREEILLYNYSIWDCYPNSSHIKGRRKQCSLHLYQMFASRNLRWLGSGFLSDHRMSLEWVNWKPCDGCLRLGQVGGLREIWKMQSSPTSVRAQNPGRNENTACFSFGDVCLQVIWGGEWLMNLKHARIMMTPLLWSGGDSYNTYFCHSVSWEEDFCWSTESRSHASEERNVKVVKRALLKLKAQIWWVCI